MNKQILIGFFAIASLIGLSLGFIGCGEPPGETYACNGTVLSVYAEPDVDCAENTDGRTRCSCAPEDNQNLNKCACVPPIIE